MKTSLLILVSLLSSWLMACACASGTPGAQAPASATPAPAPAPNPKDDLIRIEAPTANGVITSPLRLAGSARGQWYFEATFPVKLLDAHGKLLAQSFVQASGEWMTTDFVPFEGKLIFDGVSTPTGTLVFEKANASGLPEHADELRIPVRFAVGD